MIHLTDRRKSNKKYKLKYKTLLAVVIIIGGLLSPKLEDTLNNLSGVNYEFKSSGDTARTRRILSQVDCNKISSQSVDIINDNKPFFKSDEITTKSYEKYSDLDDYGRCQTAMACIGKDIMPTDERGYIGNIRPSGWHTVKYPGVIDGNYLYNRCHLIAYCLAGENANDRNLITGTRYLNNELMLPYEVRIAKYMDDKPKNHVMYRVTPKFTGKNQVCDGVLMEALSVEDHGKGISFCVFCKNVQPGIQINYLDGSSRLAE